MGKCGSLDCSVIPSERSESRDLHLQGALGMASRAKGSDTAGV